MANVVELKAEGVEDGAGLPVWLLRGQMPITGSSLVSVGWPDSSRAVTAIEAVRLACAVNWKKSTLPWPEIHDPHAPPCGSVAGFLYVDPLPGCSSAISLCSIRMSCSAFDPLVTVTTIGANAPDGVTCLGP